MKGTIVLFCNFWNERIEVEEIIGDLKYIIAFPTAGGHMDSNWNLNCVLFDHIMLEPKEKTCIENYSELISLLNSTDINYISMQRPFVADPSFLVEWQIEGNGESKCKTCNNCYWKKTSTCFINRPAKWDVQSDISSH
jgi:hypothetical protein